MNNDSSISVSGLARPIAESHEMYQPVKWLNVLLHLFAFFMMTDNPIARLINNIAAAAAAGQSPDIVDSWQSDWHSDDDGEVLELPAVFSSSSTPSFEEREMQYIARHALAIARAPVIQGEPHLGLSLTAFCSDFPDSACDSELCCVTCLTNARSVCFVPCGHYVVCLQCSKKLRNVGPRGLLQCIQCRQDIQDIIRVYT